LLPCSSIGLINFQGPQLNVCSQFILGFEPLQIVEFICKAEYATK
jgi:hypothetical protein